MEPVHAAGLLAAALRAERGPRKVLLGRDDPELAVHGGGRDEIILEDAVDAHLVQRAPLAVHHRGRMECSRRKGDQSPAEERDVGE